MPKCFERLQLSPAEDRIKEIPAAEGKYKLCVDWGALPDFVAISNKDESGKPLEDKSGNLIHELRIEGDPESRKKMSDILWRLTKYLNAMRSMIDGQMDEKDLPQKLLSGSGLAVERSTFKNENLIFIRRIEDEDKVSISEDNIELFEEKLNEIFERFAGSSRDQKK